MPVVTLANLSAARHSYHRPGRPRPVRPPQNRTVPIPGVIPIPGVVQARPIPVDVPSIPISPDYKLTPQEKIKRNREFWRRKRREEARYRGPKWWWPKHAEIMAWNLEQAYSPAYARRFLVFFNRKLAFTKLSAVPEREIRVMLHRLRVMSSHVKELMLFVPRDPKKSISRSKAWAKIHAEADRYDRFPAWKAWKEWRETRPPRIPQPPGYGVIREF